MKRRDMRGFALVVTLWSIVGLSALVLTSSGAARDALGAARNRASSDQAYWAAVGCLSRTAYLANEALWPEGVAPDAVMRTWTDLDVALQAHLRRLHCDVEVLPAGTTADVNRLSGDELRRLLAAAGINGLTADSLADALLDWRDHDDAPRPRGAEREWYAAHKRSPPRNAAFASPEEVREVRGFDDLGRVASMFGVAKDRIVWRRAPIPVIASLPGMTSEAIEVLLSRGYPSVEQLVLVGSVPEMPASARDSLARNARALIMATTTIPDAWIIRTTARRGSPPIAASVEIKAGLAGHRLVTLQQVTRP